MKKHIRICLTGGHLSPAYAVGGYIKKHTPDASLFFIGRQQSFTVSGSEARSVEKEVMGPIVEKSHVLPIRRLNWMPQNWISMVHSIIQAHRFLTEEQISVVVCFGGYVGFVVGVAAFLKRIPIVIHEQTHAIGLANTLLEKVAAKFCVSYKELESKKRILTGFPLREEFLYPPQQLSFSISSDKPILYITGGTTGAVTLNDLCFPLMNQLLDTFVVVHQTGELSLKKAQIIQSGLSEERKTSYHVHSYLQPQDAAWLLHNASLVISRAGANTVYELAVSKIPSILFPLTFFESKEQQMNAEWLKHYAPTTMLPQETTNSETLMSIVRTCSDTKTVSEKNFPKVQIDGTKRIADEIFSSV